MKRKIGSIVLAGVLACMPFMGMIGCGGKTVSDFVMPEGGFDTSSPVEIKFYHTMGKTLRDVLQTYLAQFKELYPNITVVEEQVGDYPAVRERIVNEINAGTQPDLAYCYPDHVAMYNQSNSVLSLNGFLPDGEYKDMTVTDAKGNTTSLGFSLEQKNAFIEGYYNEGYQFGDGSNMYTLPFSKSTEVLYYNKTFFDEHELKVPTTWDEMEEVCKKIKGDKDAGITGIAPDSTPFGYDSESNWFITMCEQLGSPYTSASGNHFLFNNQTNKDFVTRFKGWYDKGYFITKELNKGYTSDKFKNQQSYMSIGSSAGSTNQRPTATDGKYPFEVGIASIPQANPDKPKVISQGPSICILKQNDPQRVLASWLLAKYLTTNIGFQAQFSSVSGYVPVITTVTQNETYKNNLDKADGGDNVAYLSAKICMKQVDAYYASPAFVGSSKARDEVGYLMQGVFSGTKTVDQAFADAIEECEYYNV